MSFAPERAWLLVGGAIAFLALSSGLARALRAPGLTEFFPLPSGRGEKEPWRVPFWIDGAGLGWLAAFAYGVLDPRPSVCLVLFAVLSLHPLAHALATWRAERSFRVRAAALLRATTAGPDVAVEGRIAGEGTQLSRGVLYVWQSTTSTYWTKGDKGNSVERERTTTFTVPRANANVPPELALQSGERVTLDGALLATDRRWFVSAGKGNSAHARTSVEGGDAVLLVGRRGEDGALRAKGAETLLLFTTPHADGRARLRRLLAGRRALPWLLAGAMSALSITLGGFCPFGSRYGGTAMLEGSACAYDLLLYYDTMDRPRGTLRLSCDGVPLYGGFGMGQMDCTFAGSPRTPTFTCSDTDPLDGDPAVTLGTDGALTVMDDRYATRAGQLERVEPVPYRWP